MDEFHLNAKDPSRTDTAGIHKRGPCEPAGPRTRETRAKEPLVSRTRIPDGFGQSMMLPMLVMALFESRDNRPPMLPNRPSPDLTAEMAPESAAQQLSRKNLLLIGSNTGQGCSAKHLVIQMHFTGVRRGRNAFQLDMLPQSFEQENAAAKQYRGDIQVQLVN